MTKREREILMYLLTQALSSLVNSDTYQTNEEQIVGGSADWVYCH